MLLLIFVYIECICIARYTVTVLMVSTPRWYLISRGFLEYSVTQTMCSDDRSLLWWYEIIFILLWSLISSQSPAYITKRQIYPP